MKEKILKPIRDTRSDYENLEDKILKLLKQEVYMPLLGILKTNTKVLNSIKDVVDAIEAGNIKYQDSGFVGVFSAEISKELKRLGAVWSKRSPKWLIRTEMLPGEVQAAITKSSVSEKALKAAILKELNKIAPAKTANTFDATKLFEIVTKNIEIEFQKTTKGITVAPKLSEAAKQKMAEEYSQNLKKHIQGFTEEEILRLRKDIEEHVFKGNRYKELIEKIKTSYGVSQRKAKFLASQETRLLTSKLKEVRYKDVGIDEYIWQTVKGTPEHPVRPMHKKLNGTKQRFSSPPITNEKGQRNNPGEDYRCRCVARPIVKF